MAMQRLNVAMVQTGTTVLGPGIRSILWVQGCPFQCKGCFSPSWIPNQPNQLLTIPEVADLLWSGPIIEGITISGGEPFLQPSELSSLVQFMRQKQPSLSVLTYSGFRLSQLTSQLDRQEVRSFLSEIDVLIDGPYDDLKNNNLGLRGSTNQTIHHLTDRYRFYDFETGPRKTEFYLSQNSIQIVGVPPIAVRQVVHARLADSLR